MNRDLSKFEPPKAEPDGLTKKLFGSRNDILANRFGIPMEKEPAEMPFTEDQFFRISTNVRILSRNLHKEGYGELQESINQLLDYAGSCHDKFADQFRHNPRARRICPNPKCHSIYAYFYEDFLYCPKCGTKLETGCKRKENK